MILQEMKKRFEDIPKEEQCNWNPRAITLSASNLARDGDPDTAIQLLLYGLSIYRNDYIIAGQLGKTYSKKGNFSEAEMYFQYALFLDPLDKINWTLLGDVYKAQNNHFQARICYSKVLEIDPNDKIAKRLLEAI